MCELNDVACESLKTCPTYEKTWSVLVYSPLSATEKKNLMVSFDDTDVPGPKCP